MTPVPRRKDRALMLVVALAAILEALLSVQGHAEAAFAMVRQRQWNGTLCTGSTTVELAYVLHSDKACARASPMSSFYGSCGNGGLSGVVGFSTSDCSGSPAAVLLVGTCLAGTTTYSCETVSSYATIHTFSNATSCAGEASASYTLRVPLDGSCNYGQSYTLSSSGTHVVQATYADGACRALVNSTFAQIPVGVCSQFSDAGVYTSSRTAVISVSDVTVGNTTSAPTTRCISSASAMSAKTATSGFALALTALALAWGVAA